MHDCSMGKPQENMLIYIKKGGVASLLEIRYQGGCCRLSIEQLDVLPYELNQKIHLNTDSIIELVESKFSTSYTKSGMTTLLHRLGHVYKKPKLIPSVPDEDIQEWFVEHYHDFMANKSENVGVFFMDATHPEHNAQAAAALIYVIMDNAGYHHSGEVLKYLKTSRIRSVLLPPRSPNLNLIERLWRLLKEKVVYNKHYEKYKDFRDACVGFFKNLKDYEGELTSLMSEEFQIITR